MNKDLITLNEVLNSGSSIDLRSMGDVRLFGLPLIPSERDSVSGEFFNTYADALCMYNRSRPQKVGRRKSADYRSQRRVLPPIHRVQDRCRLLSNLGEQPEIKSTGNERTIANLYARSDRLVLYLLDISLYPESSQNKEYRR